MSRKILVYKTVHQRAVGVRARGCVREGGAVAQGHEFCKPLPMFSQRCC